MLGIKDIENLARLARIELTQTDKEKLLKEVDPILGYVAQINEVVSAVGETKMAGVHRNITREDANPNETGSNTKAIVENMPEKQNDYLKVKKIL